MNAIRPLCCPICKQPLEDPVDRALGVCANPQCRGPFFRKQKLNEDAKRRHWRSQFAQEVLLSNSELVTLNVDSNADSSSERIVVVVPTFDRKTTILPEHRKRLFTDHLEVLLAEATELVERGDKVEHLQTEFSHRTQSTPTPLPSIVLNGCSTCRGYCCQHGGTTAFLTGGFLAWQMLYRQTSVDVIREQYVSQLPNESIEDSCVFHTPQGCVLSREQRSELCNNFLCEGLMDAFESFDQEPKVYSIAIATDGERAFRIGRIETTGVRQESIC